MAPARAKSLGCQESQPLFYTSCQRATHEYVCQRGRSHNLCKVSSCIMQLIYASPGCECAQESTHTHTHTDTHLKLTTVLWWGGKQTPENPHTFSHPELPAPRRMFLSSLSFHIPFLRQNHFHQHLTVIGFTDTWQRSKVGSNLTETSASAMRTVKKTLFLLSPPPWLLRKRLHFPTSATSLSLILQVFFIGGGTESLSFLIKGATTTGNRVQRHKAAGAEEAGGDGTARRGVNWILVWVRAGGGEERCNLMDNPRGGVWH